MMLTKKEYMMADVTFGVKVPEEMKNELSELMKSSTVSGKEFMGMLIASYKMEQAKTSHQLYEAEFKELQGLMQRMQNIYRGLVEKGQLETNAQQKTFEEEKQKQDTQIEVLRKQLDENKEKDEVVLKKLQDLEEALKQSKAELEEEKQESLGLKQQLKNQMLLQGKYEEEIKHLHLKLEGYKRLDLEIEERNEECTKLKTRNDELASEIWFLKREVEKLATENKQSEENYKKALEQEQLRHSLELKNALLEKELLLSRTTSELNYQIAQLKEAKLQEEHKKHQEEAKK